MLGFALAVISILCIIVVYLFFKAKTLVEKIQVTSALNSLIIIMISVYCYYIKKPAYIDIALLYAILSYVSILAFRKYFHITLEKNKRDDSASDY